MDRRLLIALTLAVVAVLAASRSIWKASFPNRSAAVDVVRPESPLGELPKFHKATRQELREDVRSACSNIGLQEGLEQFVDATCQIVESFSTVDRNQYDDYLRKNSVQPPKDWGNPEAVERFRIQFETANALVCGSKSATVRARYLDGKPLTTRGFPVENVIYGGPTRHAGLPDLKSGKLDVYEIVVPAYKITSFGGRQRMLDANGVESVTTTGDEVFDGAIGLWLTYFEGEWYHVATSVYGKPGHVVALPLM